MKIKRIIEDKVKVDYVLIDGFLNINSNYFIKEINKGVGEKNNNNFNTNVIGHMTSYEYFNNNKNFLKSILPLFDCLDSLDNIKPYNLSSAWGIREDFSHFTKSHHIGFFHLLSLCKDVFPMKKMLLQKFYDYLFLTLIH